MLSCTRCVWRSLAFCSVLALLLELGARVLNCTRCVGVACLLCFYFSLTCRFSVASFYSQSVAWRLLLLSMFYRVVPSSFCVSALVRSRSFQSHACAVVVPFGLPQASRQFCSPPTTGFPSQLVLRFFPSGITGFGLYFLAGHGAYINKPRQGCAHFPATVQLCIKQMLWFILIVPFPLYPLLSVILRN